jgi:FHA domain
MTGLLSRSLGVVCPSCDFLNVIGATRCMACGSPCELARAEPLPQPPGLRRTGFTPGPLPAAQPARRPLEAAPGYPTAVIPPPAAAPHAPVSARPFASSQTPLPQTAQAPRFALSITGGPSTGQRFRVGTGTVQVGRSRGIVLLPDDPFASSLHASFGLKDGRLFVRDEGSHSGIFVAISTQETVLPGSLFATGDRLFRYLGSIEVQPPVHSSQPQIYGAPLPGGQTHYLVEEVLLGGRAGRSLLTAGPVIKIGRSRCDFSYPNDESLAPVHCEIAPLPHGAMVRDLSAGFGTFVKVQGDRPLKANDRVRIGQHTLQVEVIA